MEMLSLKRLEYVRDAKGLGMDLQLDDSTYVCDVFHLPLSILVVSSHSIIKEELMKIILLHAITIDGDISKL